jgi:hypothetical protein
MFLDEVLRLVGLFAFQATARVKKLLKSASAGTAVRNQLLFENC